MEFIDDSPEKAQAKAAPYIHQPFPSVRYHRSGETMEVLNQDESDALAKDPDWSDTPATFNPHSAPSRAQIEEEARGKREAARQQHLAAAREKAEALSAANEEIARLRAQLEKKGK